LIAYAIFAAFTVAIPLGLLTVFGSGLVIGMLGHSLDN
jgi:MFS superfamily sulfate permease-like transporter